MTKPATMRLSLLLLLQQQPNRRRIRRRRQVGTDGAEEDVSDDEDDNGGGDVVLRQGTIVRLVLVALVLVALIVVLAALAEGGGGNGDGERSAYYDLRADESDYNATGARFLNEADGGREYVRVVVGFLFFEAGTGASEFERENAVTMTIPVEQVEILRARSDVAYVEEDALQYAQYTMAANNDDEKKQPGYLPQQQEEGGAATTGGAVGEITPWGITAIQGDLDDDVPPPALNSGDNTCFSVCLIDSGVLLSHEDMPHDDGASSSSSSSFARGQSFGVDEDNASGWSNPKDGHGTHVAGTLFAKKNGVGVRGVIPFPSTTTTSGGKKICLLVARVFGDGEGTTANSYIAKAVEWCADNGAKVINMSLGSPYRSTLTEHIITKIAADEDVLIVAAAGNSGGTEKFYPASYDDVISVASVDEDLTRSSFSVHNNEVTVTAPGHDILSLSTHPSVNVVTVDDDGGETRVSAMLMKESVHVEGTVSASPVDCGLAAETCNSAAGRICVIERGQTTFQDKARVCQEAGGVAAVIYNNEEGNFFGTISEGNSITIPVMSIQREDAQNALAAQQLTLEMGNGAYTTMSGTSMAGKYRMFYGMKLEREMRLPF